MPMPTIAGTSYNPFLTNVSVAYFQDPAEFACLSAFPTLPVSARSGKIVGWSAADLLRDDMIRRAPGSGYARIGAGTTSVNYNTEEWGLEWPVDDLVRAASMQPYNLDTTAARGLAQKAMIRMERQWVTDYFATGIWTTDLTGGTSFTQWDDVTSDPVDLIKTNKRLIKARSGKDANTLVCGRIAWDKLSEHPDLQERLGAGRDRILTRDQVASIMEIDRVVVSSAIYNSADEGLSLSGSFAVSPRSALLVYSTPTPAENEATAGYTTVWSGWIPGGNAWSPVSTYRDETIRSDVHRIDLAFDFVKVAADLGVFFSNAVAATA